MRIRVGRDEREGRVDRGEEAAEVPLVAGGAEELIDAERPVDLPHHAAGGVLARRRGHVPFPLLLDGLDVLWDRRSAYAVQAEGQVGANVAADRVACSDGEIAALLRVVQASEGLLERSLQRLIGHADRRCARRRRARVVEAYRADRRRPDRPPAEHPVRRVCEGVRTEGEMDVDGTRGCGHHE